MKDIGAAGFVINSDRLRYEAAQESKLFRDAQLRRLSRALERISLCEVYHLFLAQRSLP
jgi:hypothetical protein